MLAKQRFAASKNDLTLSLLTDDLVIWRSLKERYSNHRISRFSLVVYVLTADSKASSAPVKNISELGTEPVSSWSKLKESVHKNNLILIHKFINITKVIMAMANVLVNKINIGVALVKA